MVVQVGSRPSAADGWATLTKAKESRTFVVSFFSCLFLFGLVACTLTVAKWLPFVYPDDLLSLQSVFAFFLMWVGMSLLQHSFLTFCRPWVRVMCHFFYSALITYPYIWSLNVPKFAASSVPCSKFYERCICREFLFTQCLVLVSALVRSALFPHASAAMPVLRMSRAWLMRNQLHIAVASATYRSLICIALTFACYLTFGLSVLNFFWAFLLDVHPAYIFSSALATVHSSRTWVVCIFVVLSAEFAADLSRLIARVVMTEYERFDRNLGQLIALAEADARMDASVYSNIVRQPAASLWVWKAIEAASTKLLPLDARLSLFAVAVVKIQATADAVAKRVEEQSRAKEAALAAYQPNRNVVFAASPFMNQVLQATKTGIMNSNDRSRHRPGLPARLGTLFLSQFKRAVTPVLKLCFPHLMLLEDFEERSMSRMSDEHVRAACYAIRCLANCTVVLPDEYLGHSCQAVESLIELQLLLEQRNSGRTGLEWRATDESLNRIVQALGPCFEDRPVAAALLPRFKQYLSLEPLPELAVM